MIFQLNNSVNAMRQDIKLHIVAGAGLYTGMWLMERYDIYHFENKLLLVALAGISKEIHDYMYEEHTASAIDIIATFAGGFVMYTVLEW